ncbi:zona pellucida sperm-binding protein 3 [Takifugu rubripes]|uniref:zona pellucida sperm-binding protein 3 n=1 Tax=Takifugu rubripes TaxID=31033 RepID=UPI0005D2C1D1|nr:zona pellucida sperm-binding protein 3-like [Takifugu rubripes]|eukprot:XP_011614516.1 PREDICTED: zona pellucida sperm-binding protein 3-like [Takifugu rubripes]
MNTSLYLYILWVVLSIGLLCAVDTHESPNKRTKKLFNPGEPIPKPKKLSITGYSSIYRIPHKSPVFRRRTKGPRFSPGAGSPRESRTEIQSDFAYVPDVSVTCSTSGFVLRVKPSFYGLGADADELSLGGTCRSNGLLQPYGDLLFTYPLVACDVVRHQPSHDHLVYKYLLRYEPSPKRLQSQAHPIQLDIECRYPRNHHVYQLSVQPTWKTAVVRKRLKGSLNKFQMELMDGSWNSPVLSPVYQLGNKINFQVSADLSPGEKVYINSCYAKPTSGSQSQEEYTIIDQFGCLLDSKTNSGASHFISRTDRTLRFSLKAFQFTSDPETEVSVHCTLFVTSEDPGPAQKSCTYGENRWNALTGDDSICECCDSQCVTSKSRRAMMEGSVNSGSLLVSDQPMVEEEGFLPKSWVSTSKEGEATVIGLTDPLSHDAVQQRADLVFDDEEEEQQPGRDQSVTTQPDLEDLGLEDLEDKNESFSNQFEDDGSGNLLVDEYLGSYEGVGGKELSGEQEKEVAEQMVPAETVRWPEFQPKVSEEIEAPKNESGLKMRNDSEEDDVGEDGKKTWYFWK